MVIRESTAADLPAIVGLLRQSIGEVLTPKTEAYFSWKHEKNPFGPSKVLLALEGDKIIGLRAFMRWRWNSGTESLTAVRAVDTATDPAHQGKGIFKKLTLQVVDECKEEGVALVFNSPNPVSMQGYLKMGWIIAGRLPVYLGMGSLFPRLFNAERMLSFYDEYPVADAIKLLKESWELPRADVLHTPINYNYLAWRYRDCPVAKYGAIIRPGEYGIVFRMKKLNRFTELRVCEVWSEGPVHATSAKRAFRKLIARVRPAMVSCAASPLFMDGEKKIYPLFGPFKKGPVITVRPLAKENLDNFVGFRNWQPSLGSMELF